MPRLLRKNESELVGGNHSPIILVAGVGFACFLAGCPTRGNWMSSHSFSGRCFAVWGTY